MPENREQTPLVGPYTDPLASNPRATQDIERTYQERTAANRGGGGRQVFNGPRGLNDSGTYWREVQGNELSSNRLEGILNRGGAYIQGARSRAGRAIAGRGGFNSNLAIAEAEGAAIERGGEFAMQEAEAFGRAASENQAAFNTQRLAQEQNLTQLGVADIGAGATIGAAQIRVSGDLIQQDRDHRWRTGEREADDRFRREDREDNQSHDTGMQDDRQQHDLDVLAESERIGFSRDVIGTFLSNPDLWNDPTAFQGFVEMIGRIFPQFASPGSGRPVNGSKPATDPRPGGPKNASAGGAGRTQEGRRGSSYSARRNMGIRPVSSSGRF